MRDLIDRARALGLTLLPPPDPALLNAWEAANGQPLLADVRAFYTACDGFAGAGLGIWLYTFSEATQAFSTELNWYEPAEQDLTETMLPLAMDDTGHLTVVLTTPPCAGRLACIDHESPYTPAPSHVSFHTFLSAQLEVCGQHGRWLELDYPAQVPYPGDADAADACLHLARTAGRGEYGMRRLFYLSLACGMLPLDRTDEMLGWLDEVGYAGPVWEALAARQWPAAVPALAALLLRREGEGADDGDDLTQIANAIAKIGTPEAKATLLRLGERLSVHQLLALEEAITVLGARVRRVKVPEHQGFPLRVRFPGKPERLLYGREGQA